MCSCLGLGCNRQRESALGSYITAATQHLTVTLESRRHGTECAERIKQAYLGAGGCCWLQRVVAT
jgi:hypothetical protein